MSDPIERIGIIGGSGLYDFDGLADAAEHTVQTPFGSPSDVIVTGRLGPAPVAFLARPLPDAAAPHRRLPLQRTVASKASSCAASCGAPRNICACPDLSRQTISGNAK